MVSPLRLLLISMAVLATAMTANAQRWALPKVSVAILRAEPRHGAEQVSQVVMGTPLKVTRRQGEWWKIETPEGYSGYVRNNTLQGLDDSEMHLWRASRRVVVATDRTVYAMSEPSGAPAQHV